MGRLLRRVLLFVGLACIVLYCAGVAWLMWRESAIVFAAPAQLGARRPHAPFEQIDLARADGARQFAWVMRSTEDPATPIPQARHVAQTLARGRLLVAEGEQHTSFDNGNRCVDSVVARYLLTLRLPPLSFTVVITAGYSLDR